MRIVLCGAACCFAAFALAACGGRPTASNQNATSTNQTTVANTQSSSSARSPMIAASPRAATPQSASSNGSGGEFVDTSRYDAEIKRLEAKAKKNPADQATRLALAKAYTDRGDALTGVRQYRAALGDYRRALRNNPNNQQAQQMAGTIIGILKSMGRDVPPEGQEPPPIKQ